MNPISVHEFSPGKFTLMLIAGMTSVEDDIEALGHTGNGYFWESIAKLLITTEAPALQGRVDFDSEGGTFVALSNDRQAIDDLAARIAAAATDAERVRQLITLAMESGAGIDD